MASHSHQPLSCQLCAIPFAIGRTRTIHEPLSSSFDATTSSPYHLRDATSSRCSRNPTLSGCKNIVVEKPHDVHAESRWQHLAGEGCTFEGGYSGWRIGVREMSGMRDVRFLIQKLDQSEDEKEFVEGEREGEERSRFFISEEMEVPYLEGETTTVNLPSKKHGVAAFTPLNLLPPFSHTGTHSSTAPVGIPLHSTCFSIFSRISLSQLGRIDIDGLAALCYSQSCGVCGFQGLKHNDDVIGELKENEKFFWKHRVGTEYLVANPVDIPGFKLAMMGVYGNEGFGYGGGAIPVTEPNSRGRMRNGEKVLGRRRNSTDPFSTLPPEVKNKVLAGLSPAEISALCLSSRSSSQPPKQIFKTLIAEEMPWFWEIDDIRKEVEEEYKQGFREQLADLGIDVEVNGNGTIEGLELLEGVMPSGWLRFVRERMEGKEELDVDWLEVFKQLRVMEKGCLGFRNRKRVWELAEEAVKMIEGMKEKNGGGEVEPEDVSMKGLEESSREKAFSSCPECAKVQNKLDEEDDDAYEEHEEEDSELDSYEESSDDGSLGGQSSVGETSVEEGFDDACSSGEDSD